MRPLPAPRPFGLGLPPEELAVEVERRAKLRAHGGDRKSEKAREDQVANGTLNGKGTNAVAYTLARLERDAPELAADPEALDLLDRATQHQPGAGKNQHTGCLGNNVPEAGRPEGNTAAKAIRRLRKDRPDLHARVLEGDLSAHAAAIEAWLLSPEWSSRSNRWIGAVAGAHHKTVARARRQLAGAGRLPPVSKARHLGRDGKTYPGNGRRT